LFNLEGESSASAIYVTYGSLADMLTDSNRTGQFVPDNTGPAAANVVGSGAFIDFASPPPGVPEPAWMLLVMGGLAGLGLSRVRARSSALTSERERRLDPARRGRW
jgi:hypothetical protein